MARRTEATCPAESQASRSGLGRRGAMSRLGEAVRRQHLLRLCGATLVVVACGKDSTAPPPPAPGPAAVAYVEVTPAAAGVVIGHTLQLTAKVRDAAANELQDRAVTWTTNAPTQATGS